MDENNRQTSRYCPGCGLPFSEGENPERCPSCGVNVQQGQSYSQGQQYQQQNQGYDQGQQYQQQNQGYDQGQQYQQQNQGYNQGGYGGGPRDPNMVYPESCRTSPGISAVINLFIPGLAQILNGQVGKGVIMLVVYFIFWCFIGMFLPAVICIFSMVDAYQCAKKLQSGQPIGKFSFF